MTGPGIGTLAPNFATKNQYGQDRSLSSLRGAPAVLVFYPFAFTRVCTSELGAIRDQIAEFARVRARVLALSTDTMFTLRVFAEQERLGFDLLTDHWPHGAIATRYGVFDDELGCARRGTFVLDAEGRVAWSVLNSIGEARALAPILAGLTPGQLATE